MSKSQQGPETVLRSPLFWRCVCAFEIYDKGRAAAPEIGGQHYGKLVLKQNSSYCPPGFSGAALRLSGGIDNTDDMIYHVSTYLESP